MSYSIRVSQTAELWNDSACVVDLESIFPVFSLVLGKCNAFSCHIVNI